ncbi:MAG: hypothetical protein JXR51_16120 [Bacteroidales bacterium]|nr:hypothetical protein [Bacteroidales bacterium]MBN2758694.1 hypothetical protein [Bacteroidales bacterium]
MKKLDLEEMENVQGGEMAISCDDVSYVLDYLYVAYPDQYAALKGLVIQCTI